MTTTDDTASAGTQRSAGVADTMQAGGVSDHGTEAFAGKTLVELAEGTLLDGVYKVIKRIGGGAMGTVYLVEHQHLGRRFAAKVVASAHSTDPEIIARLRNEARVASSIQHENIVDVTHLGRTPEGLLFVVMELLQGHDLRHRLVEQEANPAQPWLPDAESKTIARDVLNGLHAAHEAGIVHRDLKPDNIFLTEKNGVERAKIVDFGISKGARGDGTDMRLTRTGQIIGTPLYMSPEQTRGTADVDRRADIYAMGVILYELTTGRLPFEATSIYDLIVKHATETPPPARERRADLPVAVESVIMRCLEKQPDARYQTAREVLEAWEKAWTGIAPSARPPPMKPASVPTPMTMSSNRPPPAPESNRGVLIGGALLVVVIVVGGIAAFGGGLGGGTSAPPTSVIAAPPPTTAIAEPPPSTHVVGLDPPPPTTTVVAPTPDVVRTIQSEPAGASVEVNGASIGTTPVDLTLAGGAPTEVTVRMTGRRPVTQTITAADPQDITFTLERAGGRPHPPSGLPTLAPH